MAGPRTFHQGSPHAKRVKVSESEFVLVPQKGYWKRVEHEGRETAKLSCPDCGKVGFLGSPFEIAPDGAVSLAVACSCGWNDLIFLQEWSGPIKVGTPGANQVATPVAAGSSSAPGNFSTKS